MRIVRGSLIYIALAAVACAPRDVVPTTPDHPAHPDAPTAPAEDAQAIAAAEEAAYQRAKPVFEKHCYKCHTSTGAKASEKKLAHLNMDRYPFTGEHAGEIGEEIREVLGMTGEEATMPMDSPGSVKGAELDAIVEWSHAFDRAHAAGLHRHHEHQEHEHQDHEGHH